MRGVFEDEAARAYEAEKNRRGLGWLLMSLSMPSNRIRNIPWKNG
jgi:hypothetical protein